MDQCKKRCTIESNQFTNLPDCVMSRILSRLLTQEAAKTCVLSKDWKYKWLCVTKIDFSIVFKDFNRNVRLIAGFRTFLNKFLESDPDFRISGFRVIDKSRPNSEILSLLVENLSIQVSKTQDKMVLHYNIFPLIEFKLPSNCVLKVGIQNCFPKLQKLCLRGEGEPIRIMNQLSPKTGHLTLNFPALKSFTLECFEFLNVEFLEINAPEMIYFRAYHPYNLNDYVIKIFAQKLVQFSSECRLMNFELNAPKLPSADLVHEFVPGESGERVAMRATMLFKGAPSLIRLTLSPSIVKALVEWKEVHVFPTFDQLKHLTLIGSGTKGLMKLLQATPYLESLTLDVDVYNYEQSQEQLPSCIVSQLQLINLKFNGGTDQTDMTKLFLEKAKKLRTMHFFSCEKASMTNSEVRRWVRTIELGSTTHMAFHHSTLTISKGI